MSESLCTLYQKLISSQVLVSLMVHHQRLVDYVPCTLGLWRHMRIRTGRACLFAKPNSWEYGTTAAAVAPIMQWRQLLVVFHRHRTQLSAFAMHMWLHDRWEGHSQAGRGGVQHRILVHFHSSSCLSSFEANSIIVCKWLQ